MGHTAEFYKVSKLKEKEKERGEEINIRRLLTFQGPTEKRG